MHAITPKYLATNYLLYYKTKEPITSHQHAILVLQRYTKTTLLTKHAIKGFLIKP
jgi:hypothetical protein